MNKVVQPVVGTHCDRWCAAAQMYNISLIYLDLDLYEFFKLGPNATETTKKQLLNEKMKAHLITL